MSHKTLFYVMIFALVGAACSADERTLDRAAEPDAAHINDAHDGSTEDARSPEDTQPGGDAALDADAREPRDDARAVDAAAPDAEGPSPDTGTPRPDVQPSCNLNDNIPDDCYEVAALTRETAQLSARVQANAKPSWRCSADRDRLVFDVNCFPDGSANFPSGNWRNVLFEVGKIVSIEVPDPTIFTGEANLVYDSPSWVGAGTGGRYDVSLSRIPGDFSHNLPEVCVARNTGNARLNINNAAHPTSEHACWLEPDKTYYLNVYLIPESCHAPGGSPAFDKCSHTFVGYGDPGW